MSIEGGLQPLPHVIISFSLWNPVTIWNVAGSMAERKEPGGFLASAISWSQPAIWPTQPMWGKWDGGQEMQW